LAGRCRADPGAIAADFKKGEKSREDITDLIAGGEHMAELEAGIAAGQA
jgi:simple sugar transport system ATP-binding protein